MRRFTLTSCVLLLTACLSAGQQKKPVEIRGHGCVQTGVQPHCIFVKDLRSGRFFNLLVRGLQPANGEGIEFAGTLHPGRTPCMQGIPVDVATWVRSSTLKCTPKPDLRNPGRHHSSRAR